MNKFEKNLDQSGDNVLKKRSTLLAQQASQEAQALLNNEERLLSNLKLKLAQLSDLSPTDTTSLVIANGNFNAAEWTKQMFELTKQVELQQINVKIAKQFVDEWFGTTEG